MFIEKQKKNFVNLLYAYISSILAKIRILFLIFSRNNIKDAEDINLRERFYDYLQQIYSKMSGKYQITIRAPNGKITLPAEEGLTLSALRSTIQEYLREFYFYDQTTKKPILKYFENQAKASTTSLVIKFPSMQAEAVEAGKQIVIKDELSIFQTIVTISDESSLKQLRNYISIPNDYQSFCFLKDRVQISQASERNLKVSTIAPSLSASNNKSLGPSQRPGVLIRLKKGDRIKVQKQLQEEETKKQQQKAEETKAKVNEMIKQLQEFETKYTKQSQQKNNAKREKLNQLSNKLDSMNLTFNFKSDTDINKVITELKQKVEESNKLMSLLSNVANLTTNNQLAQKFINTIGMGRRSEIPARSNIVDFGKSKFEQDFSCNQLVSNDYDYSSQSAQATHLRTIQTNLMGGSFAAEGGNPFFFVKAGVTYDKDGQNTGQQSTQNTAKQVYKNFISLYIGTGLVLTQDNIYIRDNVLLEYQQLFFTPQADFTRKVQQFLLRYGDKIQIGSYYFGNLFTTSLQLTFSTQQSAFEASSIARSALSSSIQIGGIFSAGSAAGKASFSFDNSSGQKKSEEQLKTAYSMKAHTSSYPAVQNYAQWKEVVATKNIFWRVISRNTKFVSILKILRSRNAWITAKCQGLLSLPIEQYYAIEKRIQKIIDENFVTDQATTKTFEGVNFIQISTDMLKMLKPQGIQTLVLKRTEKCNFGLIQLSTKQLLTYKEW